MNYSGGGADASFEDIQNDIAYAVSTGSYVIDTMGNDELDGKAYDFDLVNDLSKIDVLVGGEALSKEEIADDHYGFGKTENGYRFELIYYPDGTESSDGEECIKWMINENISNFNRVQLVYSVHLTNPQTEEELMASMTETEARDWKVCIPITGRCFIRLTAAEPQESLRNLTSLQFHMWWKNRMLQILMIPDRLLTREMMTGQVQLRVQIPLRQAIPVPCMPVSQ